MNAREFRTRHPNWYGEFFRRINTDEDYPRWFIELRSTINTHFLHDQRLVDSYRDVEVPNSPTRRLQTRRSQATVEILKIEEHARKLKEEIEDAMTRLNNRPRKTLEY